MALSTIPDKWEEYEDTYEIDFYPDATVHDSTHDLLQLLSSLKIIGYDSGYDCIYYTVIIKK